MMRCLLALLLLLAPIASGAQQRHGDGLDDALQHLPMAAVYGLRLGGLDGQSAGWGSLVATTASAYALAAATTYGLKHAASELRPDHSDRRSFPSGHTTMAFAGAAALRHEYGQRSAWISVGGYAVATLVAADRVRRDRHYLHDVLAGAAVGTAATELCYYINYRFVRTRKAAVAVAPQAVALVVRF